MPLRMVKKDRDEQAKQQTQAMAKPAPGLLGASKGSKKADEPKSPTERRDEKKAQQREQRIKLKEYGMKKGGLKGNQKKLDKNNNNRIDSEDFKILRGQGKAPMKAKRGKLVPLKKDPTKPIGSVKPLAGGKGSGTLILGNSRKKGDSFLERRKKLGGAKSLIGKGGRIGAAIAALGVAGAGAAKLGQTIGRKMSEKKNKKMGGGMMKKPMGYTKGGGADTGTAGERKSQLMTAVDRFKRRIRVRKRRPSYIKPPERKPMIPADVGKVAQSLTPTGLGKQMGKKVMGKMGGGMMMKPMGYKSGTSVKVKCKLGRNKPTKMY